MRFPFWSSYLSEIVKGRFVVLFLPFTPFFSTATYTFFLVELPECGKAATQFSVSFFLCLGTGGVSVLLEKGIDCLDNNHAC